MGKLTLIIDCDDTLIGSNLALRKLHEHNTGEKIPEIMTWNGTDVFQGRDEHYIEELFKDDKLWDFMELFPHAKEVLTRLSKSGKYDLHLCTIGNPLNIKKKIDFLEQNGFNDIFSTYHFVAQNGTIGMGKEWLQGFCLIDDHSKNLTSDNVLHHILFQGESPKMWNVKWGGFIVRDWLELEHMIEALYQTHRRVLL